MVPLQPVIEAQPNLFTPFVTTSAEDTPVYTPAGDEASLRALLTAKMAEHNESNVAMDLVLFQQVGSNLNLAYAVRRLLTCRMMITMAI